MIHARPRRSRVAPTIRALAVLVLLVIALLFAVGALHGHAGHRGSARPGAVPVSVLGARVSRVPDAGPTAGPSTTTTTTTTPVVPAVVASVPGPVPAAAYTTTCADALAYLASHQAPGFVDSCGDGVAQGHLGYTCADTPGRCAGARFVRIACPAPFVFMNEAHNTWVVTGQRSGIDPYGQGSLAERAACAPHR